MEDVMQKKKPIQSVNPTSNEVQKEYTPMPDQKVEELLRKADGTYKEWRQTSYKERATLLREIGSLMRERKEELGRLCSISMGKILKESIDEVMLCASILDYYADYGEEFLQDEPVTTPIGRAFISYEPIGVILSIQPWNFPYYQVIRSAAPHIMAGNTYVLKHASVVFPCAEAIEQLFKDAGAPEGLFTNLFISGKKANECITNKYIKGITFTGSEEAGESIAATAGKVVKKTVLELGGSDPLIILEDADLDKAVELAAMERLSNAGQVCTSPKRIIVMESVAKEFTDKAKAIYENIKIGDPLDEDTQLGPVSSLKALETILKQVEDTVKEGATLVYGGEKLNSPGAFMKPAILMDIKPGMVAYSEEIFGPVLCIYPVKDIQEAIKIANDTKYGLGASILTKDEEKGIEIARQIESGMVFINNVTTSSPELPFGGTKNSGYGRELAKEGIKEFVNHKLIRISSLEAMY